MNEGKVFDTQNYLEMNNFIEKTSTLIELEVYLLAGLSV